MLILIYKEAGYFLLMENKFYLSGNVNISPEAVTCFQTND